MVPADRRPNPRVLIAARLITAVVSLAGAEGVLWFAGYPNWWALDPTYNGAGPQYEADAELGWKARQGEYSLVWADRSNLSHPAQTTNWSEGRRATSERMPPPRSPNQGRILFFGDSYVQGYGLSDSETLPWLVQKRHPELEVSNYAAGLYGTYQSYLAMKRWVQEPASVYYMFNSFHEDRNAAAPSFLRISKSPPPGWSFPYAEISHGELLGQRSPGELIWPLSRRVRLVAMVQDYDLLIKSYLRLRDKRRVTEMLLTKMNEVVAASGGKFTVILFDLEPDERKDYRRFLESQHIAMIDCDRPETKDPTLRIFDGLHPTPKLNALLAEWIEPEATPSARVVSAK
jgi:hypothetical protein